MMERARERSALELTFSSIAVLITPTAPPANVDQGAFEAILTPPLTLGQTLEGMMAITSLRDQIEVQLHANKIDVRDLSGASDFTASKSPRVVHDIIQFLPAEIRSFGINFIASVDHNGTTWLTNHLLKADELAEKAGLKAELSLATLKINRPDGAGWTLRLEPARNVPLQVNLNSSREGPTLPEPGKLMQLQQADWAALEELINALS